MESRRSSTNTSSVPSRRTTSEIKNQSMSSSSSKTNTSRLKVKRIVDDPGIAAHVNELVFSSVPFKQNTIIYHSNHHDPVSCCAVSSSTWSSPFRTGLGFCGTGGVRPLLFLAPRWISSDGWKPERFYPWTRGKETSQSHGRRINCELAQKRQSVLCIFIFWLN